MPVKTKPKPKLKTPTKDYPRIIAPPPGPKGRAIIKRDKQHSSTSYIKAYPLVVSHGKGAMVEDVDGNRYVDWMAGIAVASTGYAHPKVVEAVRESAGNFFSMCTTDWYYENFSAVCERLAKLAPGNSKKRVFVTNSGTEAVEGAIKLVRNYNGRKSMIAFKGAFHGRSYGAMSLTSSKVTQRASFGPFLAGVHHEEYPDPYRTVFDKSRFKDAGEACVADIEEDLFQRHLAPEDCAAIFVEPMIGEGGYIIPPKSFLQGLRRLCDEHGILLVCDEIQSGIGRTGKMWACEHSGVEPDVLLTAKGLASGMPLGAIIAKESVMKWEGGSHGSTYGGNNVACAAALATLDLVENIYLENAKKMGTRLMTGLKKLQKKYPCIGDVRGEGLFLGVEFVKDRKTQVPAKQLVEDIMQLGFRKGLLLLSCGKSVIRVAPPLCLDKYDVDTGLAIFEETIAELT
ncbi:MAG: aspartate aminotransferase family protein [Elusimicrobia bacterium]|nr:MAG: aspartate aminotransferase family protein [Elusimicrobiota bacterium]